MRTKERDGLFPMKNKVLVQVCDKEYSLITEEAENYVKALAAEVTDMIETTAYKNLRTSKFDAAMITCLELCDKIHKLSDANENMRREIKSYTDDIGRLTKKLATLERQKPAKKQNAKDAEKADSVEDAPDDITENETGEFDEELNRFNTPVYKQF